MLVSLKWLRNYVDFSLSVDELASRLTMAGLEVESIKKENPHLENVLTVRLDIVKPHPRADRLRLCDVSDGTRTYRVVCGASNLNEGSTVVLALPGARLATGVTIEEAQIRGESSQGMLCSQKELALGEDASGIWILPPQTPVGSPLSEVLGIEDVIIELSVTPNRGDCLSILGIAREVSAIAGSPLRYPPISLQENGPPVETLASVAIDDPAGCPRYAARVVQGVTIGPSPAWLKERLEAVGIRSINNIVDVTNFILMEMGQPLHAFDYDRLRDNRIVVRRAAEGERFTTLDGVERKLFADSLLICDGRGPVAIAGIMGGLDSEIVPETKRVLIESAYFDPGCIRRTGKKIGLRSESSYRFERGVDPVGLIRALDRAAQLMCELGGGEIAKGRIDVCPKPFSPPELTLRVERTNRFLGANLKPSEMAAVLRSIEMQVEEQSSDLLRVVPPTFRPDITREVDLAEEVVRLVGYDYVPVTRPRAAVCAEPMDPHLRRRQEVKNVLQGGGFFEVINYSFISNESLGKLRFAQDDSRLRPVQVMNPLSEEQAVMRTSLIPGLLQTARHNFDHRNEDLRIFELSKVFLPREGESLPHEPHHLAGVMAGKRSPQLLFGGEDEVDYTDVKGALEEVLDLFYLDGIEFRSEDLPSYLDPVRAASVYRGRQRIGAVGKLHAEVEEAFDLKRPVYLFELDFDQVYELGCPHPLFKPLPKYPSVARDMALIVDESVPVREPLGFILEQHESLLERVEVFDIYRSKQVGEDKKSVGYRLVYRAADRSLTDEEINDIHSGLVSRVLTEFSATLR
jgi:phenylalanyl-tRNA synthetase beta chain